MNLKNLFWISVPSSLLIVFSSFNTVYALPGDSPRESINFINRNLGRPSNIQEHIVGGIDSGYRGELTYNDFPIVIFIDKHSFNEVSDFSEGVTVKNGRIGSSLGSENYNPRQDEDLLDLVRSIWGEEISQDFIESRFTGSYTTPGLNYRNVYRGSRFGYEAMYYYSSSTKPFYFRIWNLQDLRYRTAPVGFEEQANSSLHQISRNSYAF